MMELIDIAMAIDQIVRAGILLGIAYSAGQMLQDDWSECACNEVN